MATYTAVDEAFDVELFASVKKLAKRFFFLFLDEECTTPVTHSALVKAFRADDVVCLYPKDRPYDWCFKLKKH